MDVTDHLPDVSSVYGKVSAVNLMRGQGLRYAVHVCGMSFPLRGDVKKHIAKKNRRFPKILVFYRPAKEGDAISVDNVVSVLVSPRRRIWRTLQAAAASNELTRKMLLATKRTIYIKP